MEPSQTSDTAPTEPARKPSWIMRGTFLLGGGLWLLYPVAPQVFGLMQGEPMRLAYLWAWLGASTNRCKRRQSRPTHMKQPDFCA